ncbi:unnamed protein product [Aureobasidium mustum]|uniref:Uncharacterized protein n=1 Tax=Aureobasidium mustum TaxID=2773714 RepID=A0A9N8JJ97_9PEZI|nr:unnamed protein product [Aureobasidium mustum]
MNTASPCSNCVTSNSAMEELERLATMPAHIAADGTKHDTMHINAGAANEPMYDTSQDQVISYQLAGSGDNHDINNKPLGNECDCPVNQSGTLKFTDAETHSEESFSPCDVPDTNNSSALDAPDKFDDSVQKLDVESIAAVYRDPVLMMMFRELDDHVLAKNFRTKLVARYIKLTLAKFTVVREAKECETEFPELMLAMQALEIDADNATITEADGPAQQVIKVGRALRASYSKVCKDATRKLKQLIRDTGAQVAKVYNENKEDDMCSVWYAIKSDKYYQANEILVPCHRYEFRVLVVTHLHLIGGTPSHYKPLKKPQHTPYQHFLDLLPDFLSFSRCEQAARLGYSTKGPTTGPWKYQAGDQAIPLGIATKTQRRPRDWSTGLAQSPTPPLVRDRSSCLPLTSLPGPLLGTLTARMGPSLPPTPTIAGPAGKSSLPSRSALKRSNSDDGQQGRKKSRVKGSKKTN